MGLSICPSAFHVSPSLLLHVHDQGVTLDQLNSFIVHMWRQLCHDAFTICRRSPLWRQLLFAKDAFIIWCMFSYGLTISVLFMRTTIFHINQLPFVLNAAVRLIGGIPKVGHISNYACVWDELQLLSMRRHIEFMKDPYICCCLAAVWYVIFHSNRGSCETYFSVIRIPDRIPRFLVIPPSCSSTMQYGCLPSTTSLSLHICP